MGNLERSLTQAVEPMPPPPFGILKSVNKARYVFVAPDVDVLNKKVRSKGVME